MVNLPNYVEAKRLLGEIEAVADDLMANEIEMFASLKAKYAEAVDPDPFDVTVLNVLLRNVAVRKGYDFDPRRDGGRVIDLPTKE